jgi:hypothetical protein
MTLSLSLEDLSHRYPQDIMFPALDLYQRERVGDLHFDNGRIEVDVEEEGETYQVRISLNNRGVPVDTDCTCSYCFQSGQCRHIAGVLIKLITEKITLAAVHAGEKEPEPEKRGSLPFLPAEIGRETIRIHTIAPLSPPSAPPSLLQTQSFDSSPPEPTAGPPVWSWLKQRMDGISDPYWSISKKTDPTAVGILLLIIVESQNPCLPILIEFSD